MAAFDFLLPPAEGARRADEGMAIISHRTSLSAEPYFPRATGTPVGRPSLRATFSRLEKGRASASALRTTP